jgi:hypothetical protein
MPEISMKELGCLARAVAKCADAEAGGAPLDPTDPDVTYCRNFGAREAAGQFDPDYLRELCWGQKQGCTCRAKPQRSEPGGGFTTEHASTCGIITWREHERAERQANAERIQDARRRDAGWVVRT